MINNKKTQNEEKLKRRELSENILRVIGAGALLGGSIMMPNFPIAVFLIMKGVQKFRNNPVPERKILRSLHALEKREVLRFVRKGDEMFVIVRESYKNQILRYSLVEILNFKKQNHKWDGRWRLLLFDVPEIQSNKRHQLRRLLKKLGFYKYQGSIYVFPYECNKEVDLIRRIIEGGLYMKYAVAEQLEDDKRIRSYFGV